MTESTEILNRITELETELTEKSNTLVNIRNQEQRVIQDIIAGQGAIAELKKLVGDTK